MDLLALAAEEAARVGAGVEGSVVEIDGDPRLLRRLLRNLLENAEKHGVAPVGITVRRNNAGQPSLIVHDAGPAIPAAERERIFEPFYRPAGRSEGTGGWGLGLALVRQIARFHGGQVRCEPGSDGGTAFIVELPARV